MLGIETYYSSAFVASIWNYIYHFTLAANYYKESMLHVMSDLTYAPDLKFPLMSRRKINHGQAEVKIVFPFWLPAMFFCFSVSAAMRMNWVHCEPARFFLMYTSYDQESLTVSMVAWNLYLCEYSFGMKWLNLWTHCGQHSK